MSTTTMPTTVQRTKTSKPKRGSQVLPLLVATVLLAVTGVASVLISGPTH